MSIELIIILLTIGYIIFTIDKKKDDFPVPAILVVLGVGLAFIPYFDSARLTENTIYHVFLPALLFVSAYQFPIKDFRKSASIIVSLATVGIVLNVLILGYLISIISPIGLLEASIAAAILTPTDPVSVVSIIKKATGNEEIASIVEGESMLNDGTSIVLFTTLLSMATREKGFSFFSFSGEFLLVSIGGVLIGLAAGFLVSKIVHYSHDRNYQIMLSIILAYGSFLIAEAVGVSGVLATVASGMMISYEYGRAEKEDHFRKSLDGFWEIAEHSLLAILFLVIGIEMTEYLKLDYWLYAAIIFVFMIFVRFITIYGITKVVHSLSWRYNFLLSWAGLKGSMSVFLVLTLFAKSASGIQSEWIVGVSFTVILLSLTIQSLTIAPISRSLLK
ncbi:sodium/proton antiporter, CPA1 family (TC 2.A.36) [Gracilibacillus ureilyticus]|uniref:Sodium/proton antiporter, CPA1 family (TC 2.A.36) n=1 Tax=Gracilibacillus ureilyticus TaxID=531814 RepID=A0A1H9U7I1_9BACI|nr:sodium:proton antiporter [Gracilibacillus ureilyticus]SES05309.1 sodium/proton antiporter, CPA1 family (TC 2.A.36) [Gracilibacillus ureilyticus]